MAAALIGNIMRANIQTSISATTATGTTSGGNQVLASNILANPTLGSGNYTYQWSQSGTTITFTAATSNSTNCTYGSLSVAGSTTIFCTVTDTWTGVKSVTANCVITWPTQSTPITAVTWSIGGATNSTYTASAQSVTVVSVTPSGATYSTSTTSATNAGGVASTTITGTGTYTGSFTSPNLTITQRQLTLANFGFFDCDGNDNGYGQVQVLGIQGGDSCSLTIYRGDYSTYNGGGGGVAPITTTFTTPPYDQVYNDPPGVTNPRSISNANLTTGAFGGTGYYTGIVMKRTLNYLYWVGLSGSSNYTSSPLSPAFQGFGPINQECGV